jgi:trimethylamine--corrinoid protein Co-methyltransferase
MAESALDHGSSTGDDYKKEIEAVYDRMQTLTMEEMTRIHDASMDILKNTGIIFNDPEALEIFVENDFRVHNKTVFFQEKDISKALESCPSRFKINARNPAKSVWVGEDDFVFLPSSGAPFIATKTGGQRQATIEDYENFCKLVQTSKHVDMIASTMVGPNDIPTDKAHLDMLLANILLCDKPFMGSSFSRQGCRDTMEMASIVWGGKEKLKEMPVTVNLINPLSPLAYSEEMTGSIIECSRLRQPLLIANMVMAGSSGPIRLAGVLAMQTAEVLAGLVLAQLVGPGTPIIIGATSTPLDMKSGAAPIGAPEVPVLVSMTAQMARFYKLPSRSGGSLTDAHFPDAQAGMESALTLLTAARNGVNFILQGCGTMGGYMTISYEKFIMDEEMCGMIRTMLSPVEITDESIDVENIKKVGAGGQFLTQPVTLKRCRSEFFLPELNNRKNYSAWTSAGSKPIHVLAAEKVAERLEHYQKPEIDAAVEKALHDYVNLRKQK